MASGDYVVGKDIDFHMGGGSLPSKSSVVNLPPAAKKKAKKRAHKKKTVAQSSTNSSSGHSPDSTDYPNDSTEWPVDPHVHKTGMPAQMARLKHNHLAGPHRKPGPQGKVPFSEQDVLVYREKLETERKRIVDYWRSMGTEQRVLLANISRSELRASVNAERQECACDTCESKKDAIDTEWDELYDMNQPVLRQISDQIVSGEIPLLEEYEKFRPVLKNKAGSSFEDLTPRSRVPRPHNEYSDHALGTGSASELFSDLPESGDPDSSDGEAYNSDYSDQDVPESGLEIGERVSSVSGAENAPSIADLIPGLDPADIQRIDDEVRAIAESPEGGAIAMGIAKSFLRIMGADSSANLEDFPTDQLPSSTSLNHQSISNRSAVSNESAVPYSCEIPDQVVTSKGITLSGEEISSILDELALGVCKFKPAQSKEEIRDILQDAFCRDEETPEEEAENYTQLLRLREHVKQMNTNYPRNSEEKDVVNAKAFYQSLANSLQSQAPPKTQAQRDVSEYYDRMRGEQSPSPRNDPPGFDFAVEVEGKQITPDPSKLETITDSDFGNHDGEVNHPIHQDFPDYTESTIERVLPPDHGGSVSPIESEQDQDKFWHVPESEEAILLDKERHLLAKASWYLQDMYIRTFESRLLRLYEDYDARLKQERLQAEIAAEEERANNEAIRKAKEKDKKKSKKLLAKQQRQEEERKKAQEEQEKLEARKAKEEARRAQQLQQEMEKEEARRRKIEQRMAQLELNSRAEEEAQAAKAEAAKAEESKSKVNVNHTKADATKPEVPIRTPKAPKADTLKDLKSETPMPEAPKAEANKAASAKIEAKDKGQAKKDVAKESGRHETTKTKSEAKDREHKQKIKESKSEKKSQIPMHAASTGVTPSQTHSNISPNSFTPKPMNATHALGKVSPGFNQQLPLGMMPDMSGMSGLGFPPPLATNVPMKSVPLSLDSGLSSNIDTSSAVGGNLARMSPAVNDQPPDRMRGSQGLLGIRNKMGANMPGMSPNMGPNIGMNIGSPIGSNIGNSGCNNLGGGPSVNTNSSLPQVGAIGSFSQSGALGRSMTPSLPLGMQHSTPQPLQFPAMSSLWSSPGSTAPGTPGWGSPWSDNKLESSPSPSLGAGSSPWASSQSASDPEMLEAARRGYEEVKHLGVDGFVPTQVLFHAAQGKSLHRFNQQDLSRVLARVASVQCVRDNVGLVTHIRM